MGAHEDLIRDTMEVVLARDGRLTLEQLRSRVNILVQDRPHQIIDLMVLDLVLRANPAWFVEVEPGLWQRRGDRPEAGTPSRLRRPPLAGGAAAEATPPEPPSSLDVAGTTGGRATLPTT